MLALLSFNVPVPSIVSVPVVLAPSLLITPEISPTKPAPVLTVPPALVIPKFLAITSPSTMETVPPLNTGVVPKLAVVVVPVTSFTVVGGVGVGSGVGVGVESATGAVELLGATTPNVVQVPVVQVTVAPCHSSINNNGLNAVSPKLNEAKPSLYVPAVATSNIATCQPVEPNVPAE